MHYFLFLFLKEVGKKLPEANLLPGVLKMLQQHNSHEKVFYYKFVFLLCFLAGHEYRLRS